MSSASTPNTHELSLRLAVRLIHITTIRTGARCVARIYRLAAHADPLRFVFDKAAKLPKRPTVQYRALAASSRYPFADTLMKGCVAVHRDVGDAHVDTQKFIGFDYW